jgi:hypothetical protein
MKHYLTYSEPKPVGNGLVRQIFSSVPVRYLDGDRYRDIDLQLVNVGASSFENARLPYACAFPKKANGEIAYRNLKKDMVLRPVCDPVEGRMTAPFTVYYPDAFGKGCSLELLAGAAFMRKNVVIERRPVTIPDYLEFKFAVRESGVTLPLHTPFDRTVSLDDSYLRQSITRDAAGVTYRLPLIFRKEGGRLYLVKRIPRAVLESCAYPLRFDATISPIPHTSDGYIYATGTPWSVPHDASTGTANTNEYVLKAYAGYINGALRIYRSALCFDTSALPDNLLDSEITSCQLFFYAQAYTTSGGSCSVYHVRSYQQSPTALSGADYNDIGSDNGTAGRARYTPITYYGLNTIASVGWKNSYLGIASNVSRTGYTSLGMRIGQDCQNITLTTEYYTVDVVSSNYPAYEPYLTVTYSDIEQLSNIDGGIGTEGCGYFVAGGSERDYIAVVNLGSNFAGGVGIGGEVDIELPVLWKAQDVPFVIGSQIRNVLSATASSQATGYEANNLKYVNRPNRMWKSSSSLAQTIDLSFEGSINTIALIGCNFTSYTLTVCGVTSATMAAWNDTDRDHFSGIALIDTGNPSYGISTTKVRITIPAQTPRFSETAFRIGSVIGFTRTALSSYPTFPCSKRFMENVHQRSYDGGTTEIVNMGRSYMILLYSFPRITEETLNQLQDIERQCDAGGYIFVAEDYGTSEYRFYRLCQRAENFKYDKVGYEKYSLSMMLREVV